MINLDIRLFLSGLKSSIPQHSKGLIIMGVVRSGHVQLCLSAIFCANIYAFPVTQSELSDCNSLISKEVPKIGEAYRQAKEKRVITQKHNCLLKDAHHVSDIGELLESIPENTVLFIVNRKPDDSSSIYTTLVQLYKEKNQKSSFPNVDFRSHLLSISFRNLLSKHPESETETETTLNGVIQIDRLHDSTPCIPSKTAAHLKKGTVLLGLDEHTGGYIPVCEAEKPGHIWSMFEVGNNNHFEDIGEIYISGFNFYPTLDNNPDPVDSIWRVRCYTGSVYFENNYFRLDTRSSIYLQCTHNTQKHIHFGFRNNAVIGMGKEKSNEGLLVDFRNLVNEEQPSGLPLNSDSAVQHSGILGHSYLKMDLFTRYLADISGNWFSGNLKSAIEVRLDNGSKVRLENNHVRPAIEPFNQAQLGIELHGPYKHSHTHNASSKPKFILNNNFIETQESGLELFGELNIITAGNHLETIQPIIAPPTTDEGESIQTVAKFSSPQPNYWMSTDDKCPDNYSGQAELTGYFHLVTMPGNSACNWSGIGNLHDGDL